jgi:quercetin dioxygenase-like cupin family protein
MSENIKQIAQRIKALREIAGLSAESLADEFKIPRDLFLSYESGTTDIPVSLLYEIAHKFNVELTALLTGEEPRLHRYSLVRDGKGIDIERRKEYKYQDLAYNFIHKKGEVFQVTVEPKPAGSPVVPNHHPGQEFNYVLEGTLKVMFEGHEVVLHTGDSLYFDSGQSHAMLAQNGKPAKFLAVIL